MLNILQIDGFQSEAKINRVCVHHTYSIYSVKSSSDFRKLASTHPVNWGKNLGKSCIGYSRDECDIAWACCLEEEKYQKQEIYSLVETKSISIYLPGISAKIFPTGGMISVIVWHMFEAHLFSQKLLLMFQAPYVHARQ